MEYATYPVPHWLSSELWNEKIKKMTWWVDTVIRDGYKCVDCKNGESKLLVHHINKNRKNNSPHNLVTLCSKCHSVRHGYNKVNHISIADKLKEYAPDRNIYVGTLQLIATEAGVTRERVRQIAKALGYKSARQFAKERSLTNCGYCGESFYPAQSGQKRCSLECRRNYNFYKYLTLDICKECKLGFLNPTSNSRRHTDFCDRICLGRYRGKKYGFGVSNKHRIKYQSIQQVAKDFSNEFSVTDFAKKYGYTSKNGAYTSIADLVLKGLVEKYKIRGLYRVKRKAVVDKKV